MNDSENWNLKQRPPWAPLLMCSLEMVSSAWQLQEGQTSYRMALVFKKTCINKTRVWWELQHLLWLALKVIQCYFRCVLLLRSIDHPCSRAGELDFISWCGECQRMCGPVSRSPHTWQTPLIFHDSVQQASSLWGRWTKFRFHLTLFLSQTDHLLHCTSIPPCTCFYYYMYAIFFVSIFVYAYLTY